MRFEVQQVFLRAAQEHSCWIGIPEPDPLATEWIGRAGYLPKSESCFAPTSDNPDFAFAGLVASPILRPEAFLPETRSGAVDDWQEFEREGQLPPGYTLICEGGATGLVTFCRSFLYPSIEIVTIYRSNLQGEFIATTEQEREQLFSSAARSINRSLGTTVILQESQLLVKQGIRPVEIPCILWFGPGRRFQRQPGAMSPSY